MDYQCKYLIGEKLGQGAMSSIYRARTPITNRIVALKILSPRDDIFVDLVGGKRLRQIFLEEARIMGEIRHKHIAGIIDCSGESDTPYIVLEYFPHSLGAMVGDSTRIEVSRIISVEATYSYLRQILLGLERLHAAGIVHRDIKPHNLLIDAENTVKMIDFGLCTVFGKEQMHIPGMQVGSPFYTAPEQERNPGAADERADLFGVGAIAYRLLTGRLANYRDHIPPGSTFNDQLSPDWDEFIAMSTAPVPQKRYQSACRMREDLEDIYHAWRKDRRRGEGVPSWLAGEYPSSGKAGDNLGTIPGTYSSSELRYHLNLDSWMRPRNSAASVFETADDRIITCVETTRAWQRQDPVQLVSWEEAHRYISYLNVHKWQGYDNWRLPTAEELMTLPSLCDSADRLQEGLKWLWSSDGAVGGRAWVMDLQERYFLDMEKNDMASVCGVAILSE